MAALRVSSGGGTRVGRRAEREAACGRVLRPPRDGGSGSYRDPPFRGGCDMLTSVGVVGQGGGDEVRGDARVERGENNRPSSSRGEIESLRCGRDQRRRDGWEVAAAL